MEKVEEEKNRLTTRDMEKAILGHRWGMGRYHFWEVQVPRTKERVDMVEYVTLPYQKGNKKNDNSRSEWNFYELKLTLSDLRRGRPCSWYGDYNYLVCPMDVFNGLQDDDIPSYVGVYVVKEIETADLHGFGSRFACECVRKAKHVESKCQGMMWNCFKAGSRMFDRAKGRQ